MKNIFKTQKKIKGGLLGLAALAVPTIAGAAVFKPIVPQCTGYNGECGWADLIRMGQNIIDDGVYLVAIFSVISITYAGYLYATAAGSDSQIKKAHEVFTKVIWGIFITLGAWIIVNEVLKLLGVGKDWTLLQ